MSLNTLSLINDVTAANRDGLLLNFTDRQPANVPLFIRNDGVPVDVRFVRPSATTSRTWDDIDLSAAEVKMALGKFDAVPTSGSFTLTYGADTTSALAYNASASDVQTALNALAGIGAGGVGVASPQAGVYIVQWVQDGSRTAISGDVDGLNPQTGIVVSEVVPGDVDTREVQTVQIALVPYALCDTWTQFDPAGADVVILSAGTVSTPTVEMVTLTPTPYAGTFQITTDILTTTAIPYNATASQVQDALNAEGTDYVVVGNAGGPWTITTVASGSVAAFTVDVSGLSVPVGLSGTLSLATYSMIQAFFVEGTDTITLEMEIQVTESGQEPVTVLQVPITVSKDVINSQSVTPTPTESFYTKDQVDAIIAALHNYSEAAVSADGGDPIEIPENCKLFTHRLTLGAGSGSYVYYAGPDTEDRVVGDAYKLVLVAPASSNPNVNVQADGVTYQIPTTGVAFTQYYFFTFDGSQWTSDQDLPLAP